MAVDTLANARAQYLANCAYDANSSASEARLFITACRALILHIPARAGQGGGKEIEVETAELRQQIEAARQWLAANPTAAGGAGSVVYPDFNEFRG